MIAIVVSRPVYSSCIAVCRRRNRPRRTGKLLSKRDKLKELSGAVTLPKYNLGTTKVNEQ